MSTELAVAIIVVVGILTFAWRKLSGRSGLPPIQITPDSPVAFGYKTSWLAVRGFDTTEVAQILAHADKRYRKTTFVPCNWQSGIARIRASFLNPEVFISAPIQGWVFVVNWQPLDETKPDLNEVLEPLSAKGRAGFFATHRVSSYVSWALAKEGEVFRHFSDADGQTFANFGAISAFDPADMLTSVELNETEVPPDQEDEYYDRVPDESALIEVAKKFSIDPTELDSIKTATLGLIGRPR